MYRNSGVERGYEDAIPVKRSKKSHKTRSEMRRSSASKSSVEFTLTPNETSTRSVPKTSSQTRQIPKPAPVEKPVQAKTVPVPVKQEPVKPVTDNKTVQAPAAQTRQMPVKEAEPVKIETAVAVEEKPVVKQVVKPVQQEEPRDDVISDTAETVKNDEDTLVSENEKIEGFSTIVRAPREEGAVPEKKGLTAGKIVRRSLLSVFTALILAVAAVFGACYTVATGPSESIRNILVLSALHSSAAKWVPGLFLDDAVVQQIYEDSKKVNTDVISVEDYQNSQNTEENEDKWANAIDGMIYEPVSGPTFKGYVLLVKDPSRVFVGVATDKFTDDTPGLRIFDMAEKYNAVAAINGGEYPDAGGMGIGGRPIGLTYSGGECVWNDGLRRSFMGFDENNRLVVQEGLTYKQAEELGIRDGVCFQTGKTLITNDNGNVTLYYADNDTGTAQRTAIGQAADGTVILLVTDGRTASSLGATHNDVIDVMVSYGAISAGMLDGGSSSLMYYKDFYDKYGLDKSELDEYQRKGLINRYKAFTTPRRLPTCFIVAPEN